jgi:hypothetical protein
MSFFNPTFADVLPLDLDENTFYITPYDFSKDNVEDTIFIFDLPKNIIVYICETSIPADSFDYFNPLIVNSDIINKVNFVNRNTVEMVDNFKCSILDSKVIDSSIDYIFNNLIYYPPGFLINYNNMTIFRGTNGLQICNILMDHNILPPVIPTINPGIFMPIPQEEVAQQFLQYLNQMFDMTDDDEVD